jgi:hydrogenase expression/formation protein HypC
MCMAIPMKVTKIEGYSARCEARGAERDASLLMLQDQFPQIGDFVMVQRGYAIQIISEEDALQSWALYDLILGQMDSN